MIWVNCHCVSFSPENSFFFVVFVVEFYFSFELVLVPGGTASVSTAVSQVQCKHRLLYAPSALPSLKLYLYFRFGGGP